MTQRSKNFYQKADFAHIDAWIFDLDNTLYPPDCNLFAQIDRRMTGFVRDLLDVDTDAARKIQKDFYHDYGTTLKGLMDCYQIDPDEFLTHVHDIDYSWLVPDPELARAIAKLEGRKIVFTNGSRLHAENALTQLGLADVFEAVFDIKDANYIPKPERAPYEQFLRSFGIDAFRAAMFEDLARNLEAPKALGMRTVLIMARQHGIGAQEQLFRAAHQAGEHVDFVTSNLSAFLTNLALP